MAVGKFNCKRTWPVYASPVIFNARGEAMSESDEGYDAFKNPVVQEQLREARDRESSRGSQHVQQSASSRKRKPDTGDEQAEEPPTGPKVRVNQALLAWANLSFDVDRVKTFAAISTRIEDIKNSKSGLGELLLEHDSDYQEILEVERLLDKKRHKASSSLTSQKDVFAELCAHLFAHGMFGDGAFDMVHVEPGTGRAVPRDCAFIGAIPVATNTMESPKTLIGRAGLMFRAAVAAYFQTEADQVYFRTATGWKEVDEGGPKLPAPPALFVPPPGTFMSIAAVRGALGVDRRTWAAEALSSDAIPPAVKKMLVEFAVDTRSIVERHLNNVEVQLGPSGKIALAEAPAVAAQVYDRLLAPGAGYFDPAQVTASAVSSAQQTEKIAARVLSETKQAIALWKGTGQAGGGQQQGNRPQTAQSGKGQQGGEVPRRKFDGPKAWAEMGVTDAGAWAESWEILRKEVMAEKPRGTVLPGMPCRRCFDRVVQQRALQTPLATSVLSDIKTDLKAMTHSSKFCKL